MSFDVVQFSAATKDESPNRITASQAGAKLRIGKHTPFIASSTLKKLYAHANDSKVQGIAQWHGALLENFALQEFKVNTFYKVGTWLPLGNGEVFRRKRC